MIGPMSSHTDASATHTLAVGVFTSSASNAAASTDAARVPSRIGDPLAGAGKAAVTNEGRQITVGIVPTKLLEQRHRLRSADPGEPR